MIIGNGDIASVLPDNKKRLFFASGVSNSRETRESEYAREKKLLLKQNRKAHVVYFSTLAVLYGNNRYVQHKREMEELIKQEFPRYTIMRLGNITWGINPHTIINFFRLQLAKGKPLKIQDAYRYIIDKDEFLHWVELIPDWNCEMNVTGRRMKVSEIVDEYCLIGIKSKT
ncbi:NAD(P)-dependent oxidoreductase [Candidatus Saccharibacteria bacterium]|nr:NAD(P)-dependent oxidoreductase [Candidatus Saccharibacteria bacterium]